MFLQHRGNALCELGRSSTRAPRLAIVYTPILSKQCFATSWHSFVIILKCRLRLVFHEIFLNVLFALHIAFSFPRPRGNKRAAVKVFEGKINHICMVQLYIAQTNVRDLPIILIYLVATVVLNTNFSGVNYFNFLSLIRRSVASDTPQHAAFIIKEKWTSKAFAMQWDIVSL